MLVTSNFEERDSNDRCNKKKVDSTVFLFHHLFKMNDLIFLFGIQDLDLDAVNMIVVLAVLGERSGKERRIIRR